MIEKNEQEKIPSNKKPSKVFFLTIFRKKPFNVIGTNEKQLERKSNFNNQKGKKL
jgi:hypothetical protein